MAVVTLTKFNTRNGFKVFESGKVPTKPPVLTRPELERLKKKLISDICANAPRNTGALSHPSMWRVDVTKHGESAISFNVKAVKDAPLEHSSMFKSRDTNRTNPKALHHYAWAVEFGHKVTAGQKRYVTRRGRKLQVKLPFVVKGGKLRRVNIENQWERQRSTGRLLRVMTYPTWDRSGNFERRELIKVPRNVTKAGRDKWGNMRYRNLTRLLWLWPGTKTPRLPAVHYVKRALDSLSTHIKAMIMGADMFPGQSIGGVPKTTMGLYRRQRPVTLITDDRSYETMGIYNHTAKLVSFQSIIIVDGRAKVK